jgi:hypothetical protein
MIGARGLWTAASLTLVLGAVSGSGCATRQGLQDDPANHRKDVAASAYTLGDCQEKMDELAGGHVQMTGHTQAVLGSVLNFGITPAFQCNGIIADTPIAVAPVAATPAAAAIPPGLPVGAGSPGNKWQPAR